MKKLSYLFLFFLFVFSCSKDKEVTDTYSRAFNQLSIADDDIIMTKIPIFNIEGTRIIKMRYEISYPGLTESIINEYDIDFIKSKITTPGYYWKIMEDVKAFEIGSLGSTTLTSQQNQLIQLTNDYMNTPRPDPCGQFVSLGALKKLELFIDMVKKDPFLMYGGKECLENSPYYSLWLELGTMKIDQFCIK